MDIELKSLHPLEVRLLRHVASGEVITADRIIEELEYKLGQCNQAFSWLTAKGLIEESGRQTRVYYELTDLGKVQQQIGLPAERIFKLLSENAPHSLPELAQALGLEQRDIGSAFGQLSKVGRVRHER